MCAYHSHVLVRVCVGLSSEDRRCCGQIRGDGGGHPSCELGAVITGPSVGAASLLSSFSLLESARTRGEYRNAAAARMTDLISFPFVDFHTVFINFLS